MPKEKIEVIFMGGTIDSTWSGIQDTAVVNQQSEIPEYFKHLVIYPEFIFTEICMKDSRQLTEEDVTNALSAIEKSAAKRIIVTHGTYTMPDTAKFIEANLTRKDQTIVFTGSMIPLSGFYPTDAPFNLGFALAKVQDLDSGIYICMNGETFSPSEVAKNLAEGKFYSVFRRKNESSTQ